MVPIEGGRYRKTSPVRFRELSRSGALINTSNRKTVSRIPGDTSADGPDYDVLVQRSEFIESCMKGKGYLGQ